MEVDTEISFTKMLIDDSGRAIDRALAAGDSEAARERATIHRDLFAQLARLTRPPLRIAMYEAERRWEASAQRESVSALRE
jgi:hypothetical protein